MTLDELVRSVDASSAAHNGFFERCRRRASARAPHVIVRAWAPVTRGYCLGLASYLAVLAGIIERLNGADATPWEEALLVPTHLFAEEMSHGDRGVDEIHYHMFNRLARTWPEPSQSEAGNGTPIVAHAASKSVVEVMQRQLRQPFEGAATILVVERTAPQIVFAYRDLIDASGLPLAQKDRRYVDLHVDTEPAHGSRAQHLITALWDMPDSRARIRLGVESLVAALGAFWEQLALDVFID